MARSVTINEFLRASDIKRWSMVRTLKNQNVAEHSFGVAIIAMAIAEELGMYLGDVAIYAILHDLDEVFTGDIPSHTKKAMRAYGMDWKKMEGNVGNPQEYLKDVVKAADFIEAVWFGKENAVGAHAAEVMHQIKEEFNRFMASKTPRFCSAVMKVKQEACGTNFSIVSPTWRKEND